MQTIDVLVVRPGQQPIPERISNDLDTANELVGGYIEAVAISPGVYIICNEEGKLYGLPPNRRLGNDILVGTFFIVRNDPYGEFASLTIDDMQKYTWMFDLTLTGIT